ncbi:MAG: hypothetical protein JWQ40_3396 [Segetibacter sp.]|nr:hypothetical protein [Segetibacter sp.]
MPFLGKGVARAKQIHISFFPLFAGSQLRYGCDYEQMNTPVCLVFEKTIVAHVKNTVC